MKIYVLSQGRVLGETIRRPLEAAGHELRLFSEVATCVAVCRDSPPNDAAGATPRGRSRRLRRYSQEDSRPRQQPRHFSGARLPDSSDRGPARQWGVAFLPVPFEAPQLLDVVGVVTRTRKLILLADDSALIHKHTVPILEEAGYDVVSAKDGEEALQLADEHAPDLVSADVEMRPSLDGYARCSASKVGRDGACSEIIICSALGEAHGPGARLRRRRR